MPASMSERLKLLLPRDVKSLFPINLIIYSLTLNTGMPVLLADTMEVREKRSFVPKLNDFA